MTQSIYYSAAEVGLEKASSAEENQFHQYPFPLQRKITLTKAITIMIIQLKKENTSILKTRCEMIKCYTVSFTGKFLPYHGEKICS